MDDEFREMHWHDAVAAAYEVVRKGCARSSWDVLLALKSAASTAYGHDTTDPLVAFTQLCRKSRAFGTDLDDDLPAFHRFLGTFDEEPADAVG